MQSNHVPYSYTESVARIDEILNTSDLSYEEVNSIPVRDKLTFGNGYYVNCSALFIDLRDSSGLTTKYNRPTLARIYRAFISECVAVINGSFKCSEVNIHGDAVWGVFDTPYKSDIDETFEAGAKLNSLIEMLNCRMVRRRIEPIRAGIGISWGRALMIKAGYKGSTINDVVWMGDVVNDAARLANLAAKNWNEVLMVGSDFYQNLNDHNRNLLRWNSSANCYHGNVVNTQMSSWVNANCR